MEMTDLSAEYDEERRFIERTLKKEGIAIKIYGGSTEFYLNEPDAKRIGEDKLKDLEKAAFEKIFGLRDYLQDFQILNAIKESDKTRVKWSAYHIELPPIKDRNDSYNPEQRKRFIEDFKALFDGHITIREFFEEIGDQRFNDFIKLIDKSLNPNL